tara:strand:- start:1665 stop:1892 length:228 start_codon:yes stop_codon:yes gene_type:complete
MYSLGLSTEGKPMYILAYYWLSLSKDPRAKSNILYLESIMTPLDLIKVKDMIQRYKDSVNGKTSINQGTTKHKDL